MRAKNSFEKWKADFVAERKDNFDLITEGSAEEIEHPDDEKKIKEREDGIEHWKHEYESEKERNKIRKQVERLALDKERKRKERDAIKKDVDCWKDLCHIDKERKKEERDKIKKDVDQWRDRCGADKERKREERDEMRKDVDKWNYVCAKEKDRMQEDREKIKKNVEWWKAVCYLDKERKKEERDEIKNDFDNWKDRCGADKERKREERSHQDETEKEYETIFKKHNTRKLRIHRSGKEKLEQNLKSKKGMRLLREEGPLIQYKERQDQNVSEAVDWNKFMKKSEKHDGLVNKKNPDVVQKLNEESRARREILRQKAEEEKEKEKVEEEIRKGNIERNGGEWVYNSEHGEFLWVGEREPVDDDAPFIQLTEQEELDLKLQEETRLEAMIEEDKAEKREKRRQKIEEQKAAMNKPIDPIPERALCEYEKLRISNIQEREKAMAESGFFDDLNDYKNKIGLVKESVVEDKKHKSSDENGKVIKNIKKGKNGDKKQKKLKRKQTYLKSGSNEEAGEVVDENNVDKEKIFIPAGSQKPWYENFKIDELHLHDCL